MNNKKTLFSSILLLSSSFGMKGDILDNPLETKILLNLKLSIAWRNIQNTELKSTVKNTGASSRALKELELL
jgi:hypothetical protein